MTDIAASLGDAKLNRSFKLAVRELRTIYAIVPESRPLVSSPGVVAEILVKMFELGTDPRENFFILSIDSRHRLIGIELAARGGTNACSVSAREVLSAALVSGAVAIIAAHNHPSGHPEPSAEDCTFTRRLAEGCRAVGLDLLDHVIIAVYGDQVRHVSLVDWGVL